MSRINDIILSRNTEDYFNAYIDSEVIGEKIFNSFIKLFNKDKGFPLEDGEERKYGMISNCMALSTLIELSAMKVDIFRFDEGFKFLLKDILERIYINGFGNRERVFDASPYILNGEEDNLKIESYVETISKICIIMIDLRAFAIRNIIQKKEFGNLIDVAGKRIENFNKLREVAEDLLIDCIRELNASCLKVDSEEKKEYSINGKIIKRKGIDSVMEYRGWAFQKPKSEDEVYDTSIYFTYHATNAFISLYNAFRIFFEKEFSGNDYSKDEFSLEELEKYNFDKDFFDRNIKVFTEFRRKTASTGRYIETLIKKKGIDLSFDYVKSGFFGVSSSKILEMQKNNCVIDTLFILAIFINAGIDEDYEAAEQKEYFYNQIQYALTNIRKIYYILKQNSKEDSIDSYRLSSTLFSDKYPKKYNELIQRFRNECENVAVYDLIPLLCNTYAIISDYLIQYPQKEMVENLDLIMDKRALGDKWYWDKKKFNINNNLYYIVALENFYEYYENYELPLAENGKIYNKVAEEANKRLIQKNNELDRVKNQYERLEKEYRDKKSNLDKEVYNIALEVYKGQIENSIENYFSAMISECIEFSYKIVKDDKHVTAEDLSSFPKAENMLKSLMSFELVKIIDDRDAKSMRDEYFQKRIQQMLVEQICSKLNSKG